MFRHHSTTFRILYWARRVALATVFGGTFVLTGCGGGGSNDDTPSDVTHWTKPALLEQASGAAARPQVVVDAEDNATVIWVQSDGTNDRVYALRYSAGGSLGDVVALSASDAAAVDAKVDVDGAGNVFVVWAQRDGAGASVQSSVYSPVTGLWSGPDALVSGRYSATGVRLAVDAGGTATATWHESDASSNQDLYARRFTTASMTAPVNLAHVVAYGRAGAAEVAAGPGGKAMAVWTTYADGSGVTHIWAGYFNGAGWNLMDIDAGLGDSGDPDVAFDADGNAMAVWAERTGVESASTPYLIRSRRLAAAGGVWDAGYETLSNGRPGSAEDPQVAFDSSGQAVTVWDVDSGAEVRIRFSRHTASGWGTPVYIDGGGDINFGAMLTIDGSDNITVAWESTADYSTYTLAANRYEPGTGWGGATTISAANQGDVGDVSIASDSRGQAIAVWEQENAAGTNTSAWFSIYQP
jgi:hypothetical protein